ncbi:MAG: amidase domain-containing protein [Clostridiales bacterium]|jgi:hypothetical protein|nr:amidase domain-containing protein [Clostridiales bacterium]
MEYNRAKAVAYAHEWALGRNPLYFNFDGMGGDCTNYVSQCIFAACGVMNYTCDTGWYYRSPNDRAAAWSGVEYLHRFLTRNKGAGPYGSELPLGYAEIGDIIQLNYEGDGKYDHSLFIVELQPKLLVCHHSSQNYDSRAFDTYEYAKARLIHIAGIN